ncbi:MAG: Maf family nucleotide pyrophosphatase [Bacteroidota bacterium]
MRQTQLILGSGSPRRKQLLRDMGFEIEVFSLDIDESFPDNLPCTEVASYIANQKMSELKRIKEDSSLLLTADTTVILEKQLLGKPIDADNAKWMLIQLSGKKHIVNTAVELSYQGKIERISCFTEVFFNTLNEQQIDFYISNFKPFDKAGSYGIQDWIGLVAINKIQGSYTNVVGLPTDECFARIQQLINT